MAKASDHVGDWSPADHPYSIAVSEAQWWWRTACLAILRMRGTEDNRVGFSSRQIDARQLVIALRQLLLAEDLEQRALRELGAEAGIVDALAEAREAFKAALPALKDIRDGLIHFEDWSRGAGFGAQARRLKEGVPPRDVAREHWGFAFDPSTDIVSFGIHQINVSTAARAAEDLQWAIFVAAHSVDVAAVAGVRREAIQALGDLFPPGPRAPLLISSGEDLRLWLWLSTQLVSESHDREVVADQAVTLLAIAGLTVVSSNAADQTPIRAKLAGGERLYIERAPASSP